MEQANRNISQYAKGNVIFEDRTKATKVALLVKGRVAVESAGVRDILYSGSFLGIQDVFAENYLCTYRALDDTILLLFEADQIDQLYDAITANNDYCGLVIASLCKQLGALYNNFESVYEGAVSAYNSILTYTKQFQQYAYDIKLEKDTITKAFGLEMPERPQVDEMINYYTEMNGFTIDTVRGYFSQGNYIVKYHMKKMSEVYRQVMEANQKMITHFSVLLDCLISASSESVFYKYADLALLAEQRGKSAERIIEEMDSIINSINEYQNLIEQSCNRQVNVNRQKMEETYCQIISGNISEIVHENQESVLTDAEVTYQTEGSLNLILGYGEIPLEVASVFKENLKQFANLRDRMSVDDTSRTLRHNITNQFYDIYEAVFLKAYSDMNQPLPVQLFLAYGFMDETLLEKEQIISLYKLSTIREGGKFKTYNIYEWLREVYEGRRAPSQNEYDQDYNEWLRAELGAKRITQQEFIAKSEDAGLKLHFEIHNFFRYINRIANGRVTTFVPVLHKDVFIGGIERFLVGAHKIEAALQRIIDLDYSLFYREVGYSNREKKIEKEYIMMEVLPEFILVPTVGSNAVMWQTISEKRRDTPARFVLPIFSETNINDLLLKLCGKFRWEMCRTAQGSTWNNIKYKSLTSEYLDYTQFYRKNHELSEEKKEKIKSQIQKCGNRMADVFTIDYEAWMKGESQGAVRLNKVVRRIMAMYCPFEKNIRSRLVAQPIFADCIQAFEIERQKKVREVSNRYKSLQNNQIEITKEMVESLEFYQDL